MTPLREPWMKCDPARGVHWFGGGDRCQCGQNATATGTLEFIVQPESGRHLHAVDAPEEDRT